MIKQIRGNTNTSFKNGLYSTTARSMCYNSNSTSVVLNFGDYYMMGSIEYNYILGAPNA